MDRMLYVAMTGAKETLRAQTVNNHNLANVSTTGFRADLAAFQSRAVDGTGFASRVYATNASVGWDDTSGALLTTGRDLDVAVQGPGWIAVQDANGKEAYTRAGNLQIDPTGQLQTATGQPVLGDGGPINVPPYTSILFARDGTSSIVAQGQTPDTTSTSTPASRRAASRNSEAFSASRTALVATARSSAPKTAAIWRKRLRQATPRSMASALRCFMSPEPEPRRTISFSEASTSKRRLGRTFATTR